MPGIGLPWDVVTVPLTRAVRVGVSVIVRSLIVSPRPDRDLLRRFGRRGVWIVGGRVARVVVGFGAHLELPQCGRQIVLARRQAEDPEFADVVGRSGAAGVHQLPTSLHELIPLHRHLHVGDRLPELVEHAARDDAALWQTEIDLFERLPVWELHRLPRLERTLLPVLQRDVAAFACGDHVAPGRQIAELIPPLRIRRRRSPLAKFRRKETNLRFAQRPSGVCVEDAATQNRGAIFGGGAVARRRL